MQTKPPGAFTMTGFMLGAAMLAASMGLPPAMETPTVAPTTFTFARAAALVDWQNPAPTVRPEPAWRQRTFLTGPVTGAKQTSTTRKVIAITAGAVGGFFAGAFIGAAIADHAKKNPHDDTSALRGAMIGAPIGAAVGAVIGWRLTK
jgi:hypothetical protein